MSKIISEAEFKALAAQHSVLEERDVEYGYETVVDATGRELAIATYNSFREPVYTLIDPDNQVPEIEE